MGAEPLIAFCITCGNRLAHAQRTLKANIRANWNYPRVKFVLLDYSSTDGLEDWVRREMAWHIERGFLVYYRHPGAPHFRMAHAKNMAHRLGIAEGGDILVNLDIDNFTGQGFAEYVAAKFASARDEGEAIFLRARENNEGPAGGDMDDHQPQGSSGRIVVTSSAFLAAGGYDESYVFWSPDDRDFRTRLENLGYVRHGIGKRFLRAIWHGADLRFAIDQPGAPRAFGDATQAFSTDLAERRTLTVVNNGRLGMGGVFRNFASTPIALGPLPTRIFGVGLHRTATTSLATALRRIGFDAGHWESPRWARNIVREMASGRSPTLEAFYCLADLPVGLIYQELDESYPGSKFILTIRDEQAWLRSVENHWSRYASGWDADLFSHDMHRWLYGRTDFDPETMLSRYRAHNAEVLGYFKKRPADLLVMDMSRKAGWPELCSFLNRPMPDEPYPLEFATPRCLTQEASYPEAR